MSGAGVALAPRAARPAKRGGFTPQRSFATAPVMTKTLPDLPARPAYLASPPQLDGMLDAKGLDGQKLDAQKLDAQKTDKVDDKAKGKAGKDGPGAGGDVAAKGKDQKAKASAAKGKGKAGGKAKGGDAGGRLAVLHFLHEPMTPVTGSAQLVRPRFEVVADPGSFSAPRALPFGPAKTKKADKPEVITPADYRARFAEAATASFNLFQQLNDGARRLAEEARTFSTRIADRHRDTLDQQLGRLDGDLDQARTRLMFGREEALTALHDGADAIRRKVWGASNSSLGTLSALYTSYLQAMSGPQGRAKDISARSSKAVTDLATSSDKAIRALTSLTGDPAPAHDDGGKVWTPPINEAIDAKLPEKASEEVKAFTELVKGFREPLEKLNACLPCKFSGAFADMNGRVKNVHETGPNAIRSARDAGLSSIANTELQLEDMIERGVASTDDALVKQHDTARTRYIESAAATMASETSRIEGVGRAQVRTLLAMAESQPQALQGVVDRLEDLKDRPESEFAKAVGTSTSRLRVTIATSAAKQPALAQFVFAQQVGPIDRQAVRFDLGIARGVADIAKSSGDMVANSIASYLGEVGKGLDGLKDLPGSVTQQCQGFLDPMDNSYKTAAENLGAAVDATGAEVNAMLTGATAKTDGDKQGGDKQGGDKGAGKDGAAKGDAKAGGGAPAAKGEGSLDGAAPQAVTSSPGSGPPKFKAKGGAKQAEPGAGAPAAPADTCGGCNEAPPAATNEAGTKKPEKPAPKADGKGAAEKGKGEAGAKDQMTVDKLIELSGKIAGNVLASPAIKEFQSNARRSVTGVLATHAAAIDKECSAWFSSDGDRIVAELRGTTATQGTAYRKELAHGSTLDERIRKAMGNSWGMPDTKQQNYNSAIRSLNGKTGDAAIADLRAAFNWNDDNERARQTLESLSPADLAQLRKDHGAELIAMAKELEGADRKKFEALIGLDAEGKFLPASQASANYNAIRLEEAIAAGRAVEGEEGWEKTGKGIADVGRSSGTSRLAGNDDPFNLGSDTARKNREKDQWEKTQLAYGRNTGAVPAAGKDGKPPTKEEKLSAAQQGIIEAATRTITHHHESHGSGEYPPVEWDTVDKVGDDHKLWITRIVEKGADSKEARAARLGIEMNRPGKPKRDGLDESMHFGGADAVEGGHYDAKVREQGLKGAKEEQDAVLLLYAQDQLDRQAKKDGTPHQENKRSAEEIRKELGGQLETKFGDDKKGAKDAVGIVSNPKGAPLAAIELAISSEKKEIAIQQLKRMDKEEIAQLIADYKKAHPGEKGLEEQLGINGNHWNWHNWNGATFSGDDANEIEIAFMGVPQNPKERGEIALRVMDQQTEQAGGLGMLLAYGDYKKLTDNAAELRRLMGIKEGQVDERGRIRSKDPQTGLPIKINFDENGDFVPPEKGDATAFEHAVTMSRITADNYVASVDSIANFVATALVVVAAVVTTVLTGGAAASIWIPVLVTLGAGLVGMGMNIAIKGGRYGRDDMVRDLVQTVVQAATAGIGAGAGAALRGGSPALKALAGSWRMSEQALAKAAGSAGALRALTLTEEVVIGAGSSMLAGGANAALDPAARRRDDYGMNIFHSMAKGALGGGLGALGARGGSKMLEAASKRLGSGVSQRAMAAAMAAGKSEAEVIRAGEQAVAKHWAVEIGTRAAGSGASGMASKGGEMLYDKHIKGDKISYGQIFREMGTAGLTNFIQGAAEGVGDRRMRKRYASRAEEQHWVDNNPHDPLAQQGKPREQAGGGDAEAETARLAAVARPETEAGGDAGKGGAGKLPHLDADSARAAEMIGSGRLLDAPPEQKLLPPGKTPAAEETALTPPKTEHEELAGPQAEPTDKLLPPVKHEDTPTTQVEKQPVSAGRTGESDVLLTLKGSGDGSPPAANDNGGATEKRFAVASVEMVALGPIAEGTVFVHPESRSREAANDNFGRMVLADPNREVAVYRNPVTGEYIVIQGAKGSVGRINSAGELRGPNSVGRRTAWQALLNEQGGHWVIEHHFHPNGTDTQGKPLAHTELISRLPSGEPGDMHQVIGEVTELGHAERSSRIYFIDNGKFNFTDFGINTNNPEKPIWINFPHPETGVHTKREFATMRAYHEFLSETLNFNFRLPESYVEPVLVPAKLPQSEPRALAAGSGHTSLSPRDVSDIQTVARRAQALPQSETHETLRTMGLVGEKDSIARLHLVVNDETIPFDTRKKVAALVLEANRADMVRRGELDPDEPLHLVFHGAPEGRSKSIREGGIDMTKITDGSSDDFGRGLYLTSQLDNALLYARRMVGKNHPDGTPQLPGEIFPFLMRGRDIPREMLDVRTGGKHRAAWDEFLDRVPAAYPPSKSSIPGLESPYKTARHYAAGDPYPHSDPVRGEVFEAFLAEKKLHMVAIVHGDLGMDSLTNGIGRGDQFSLRSQVLADTFNDQLGFNRKAAPTPAPEGEVLHSLKDLVKQDPSIAETRKVPHPDNPKRKIVLTASQQAEAQAEAAKLQAKADKKAASDQKRAQAREAQKAERAQAKAAKQQAAPETQAAPAVVDPAAAPPVVADPSVAAATTETTGREGKQSKWVFDLAGARAAERKLALAEASALLQDSRAESLSNLAKNGPAEVARRVREDAEMKKALSPDARLLATQLDPTLERSGTGRPPNHEDNVETLQDLLRDPHFGDRHPDPNVIAEVRKYLERRKELAQLRLDIEDAEAPTPIRDQKNWQQAVADAKHWREIQLPDAKLAVRKANQPVKDLLSTGPNYQAKRGSLKYDEYMGPKEFAAYQKSKGTPLKFDVDHLIPLSEVANMSKLGELLIIGDQLDATTRAEIQKKVIGLPDIPDNLKMMHRDANQIMKSDLNWSDISFEKAAQYGYSAEMVKAQRLEEIRVRKLITDAIAEMIKEYGKKLAEKLARERQQGTPIQTLLPPPPPPEDDTP